MRGLGNDLLPASSFWISSHSAPLWYSSVLVLASSLSHCLYSINSYKVRSIFLTTFFGGLLFLPLIVLIFNGFSDVRFKWSWLLLFPIFISAGKFWSSKLEKQKMYIFDLVVKVLFFIYLVAACYLYWKKDLNFQDVHVLMNYIVLTFLFILILILVKINKFNYKVFVLISFVEVLFNSFLFVHAVSDIDSNYKNKKFYYNDESLNVINNINSRDTGFYRIDKDFNSVGLTDSVYQNYFGVKAYISSPNPAYFNFSADMDAKPYYNFIFGFDGRYDVLRMLGVKYLLSKHESEMNGYLLVNKVDDVYTYQAKNYQGIGYVFHKYLRREGFLTLSTSQKDLAFSRCTILNDKEASSVKIESISAQGCVSLNSVLNSNTENFKLKQLNGRNISGIANLLTNGVLYLAIPYDQGFSAKVDGATITVLNVSDGFVGLDLDAGTHEVELNYFPPLFKIRLIISSLTLLALIMYVSIKKIIRIKKNDE